MQTKTQFGTFAFAIALIGMLLAVPSFADEPQDSEPVLELKKKSTTDDSNKPTTDDADEKNKADSDAKPKPKRKSSLDDDLADSLNLEGLDDESESDDLLEDAIGSMRKVSDRLADADTGEDTRKLQKGIVSNLSKLLEQLKQQQRQQPNTPQPQPNNRPQRNQGDDQQKSTQDRKQAERNDSDNASGSSSQNRKSEDRNAKLMRRALIQEIWGHLPPALRDKILNIESEKPLPKYAEHVRKYYESISEP